MNKKKLIILISIIITLAILVCVGIFALSGSKANRVAEKLDLGEKYLEELEYEKALAAYKEVLQIDPKSVEAYLGMAEVYIAMGEYEEAMRVLEEGYSETNDAKLTAKKSEVETLIAGAQATPAPTPEPTPESIPEPATTPEPTLGTTGGPNVYDEAGSTDENELPMIEYSYSDDLVIDWKEQNIESVMRNLTGIYDRDIVYRDVKYITGVGLSSKSIKDISALKYLTSLETLRLDNNQISDISILSELTNLKELHISYNEVSDISILSKLTNLEELRMYHNQISDISALSELIDLQILDLGYNNISDVSVLGNLKNLRILGLGNNPINDYSSVEHVPNVYFVPHSLPDH